jgi:tetratricopeptide (TPR) repeat protein
MRRQRDIDRIVQLLTVLSGKVEVLNSVNLTDLSVHSENFYCALLNRILGCTLKNLNSRVQNATAIDLVDEDRRICVQVTADSSKAKVRSTVGSFIENGLYKSYTRLIILQVVAKTKIKHGTIGVAGKFQLQTRSDVWDNSELVRQISGLSDKDVRDIRKLIEDALPMGVVRTRIVVGSIAAACIIFAAAVALQINHNSEKGGLRQDKIAMQGEVGSLREELSSVQGKLQEALQKNSSLVSGVAVSAEWADSISRENEDVRPLAKQLTGLAKQFETVSGNDRSQSDDALLRLARATVAIAEGRFDAVDDLIPESDVDDRAAQLSKMLLLKAEAAFGRRRWSDALTYFQRSYNAHEDIYVKLRMADCYYYLDQFQKAESVWADIGPELESRYDHRDKKMGRKVATAFQNRAGVLLEIEKFGDAFGFAQAGMTMFQSLRRKATDRIEKGNLDTDIAKSHSRLGNILEAVGKHEIAERHYLATLNVYRNHTFGDYPVEYLADASHDLGAIRILLGELEEAIAPLSAACKIYEGLVNAKRTEFAAPWASCLVSLAKASSESDSQGAIVAATQAIELLDPIAAAEGLHEELAGSLIVRGKLRRAAGDAQSAEQDFERALSFVPAAKKAAVRKVIEQKVNE